MSTQKLLHTQTKWRLASVNYFQKQWCQQIGVPSSTCLFRSALHNIRLMSVSELNCCGEIFQNVTHWLRPRWFIAIGSRIQVLPSHILIKMSDSPGCFQGNGQ